MKASRRPVSPHVLKTDPSPFDNVWDGIKTCEIRKDDRGYRIGDKLTLKRTKYSGAEMAAGGDLVFTGLEIDATVTHVLRGPVYGLMDGWVILSIRVDDRRRVDPSVPVKSRAA